VCLFTIIKLLIDNNFLDRVKEFTSTAPAQYWKSSGYFESHVSYHTVCLCPAPFTRTLCSLLHYTILYYIMLYFILLYYILFYYVIFYSIMLYCILLCYILLYYVILYYIMLYIILIYNQSH